MQRLTRGLAVAALFLAAVVVLQAAASYPSSVKSFSTKVAGDTIQPAHINEIQDEVAAIESGLLTGLAHDLKPLVDATSDLGTSAKKWRDGFFSRNVSIGGTLTVTGVPTFTTAAWATPTFAAGNFTGSGAMTVTVASGDVGLNRYQVFNQTLHWVLVLNTVSVAGTPDTYIQVAIPSGAGVFVSAQSSARAVYIDDAGTYREGIVRVIDGATIGVQRSDGGAWTASVNATALKLDMQFEIF